MLPCTVSSHVCAGLNQCNTKTHTILSPCLYPPAIKHNNVNPLMNLAYIYIYIGKEHLFWEMLRRCDGDVPLCHVWLEGCVYWSYEFGVHQCVQTLFVFKQVAGCIAEVHTWQPLDERSCIVHWYWSCNITPIDILLFSLGLHSLTIHVQSQRAAQVLYVNHRFDWSCNHEFQLQICWQFLCRSAGPNLGVTGLCGWS